MGSLKAAIEKFTPNAKISVNNVGAKTRYSVTKSGYEIVYDNELNYFSIMNLKTNQAVGLDGKVQSGNSKGLIDEEASDYERQ